MIEKLIIHPSNVGTAKLRLYPASLDLKELTLQVTFEIINSNESIIDKGIITIESEELLNYLAGEISAETMFKLIVNHTSYKLI